MIAESHSHSPNLSRSSKGKNSSDDLIGNMEFLGERNGNPQQYSCLENPVGRGAWWAAVQRVAQSRARLKQLSMLACIGEGNGSPLQWSCLESPRDRGAWWAAACGVAQGQTGLKRLAAAAAAWDSTSTAANDINS